MQALEPTENGTKASLFQLPKNLSGLKANGSSQYRAACFSVSHRTSMVRRSGILTVVVDPSDVDRNAAPGRDWERGGLTILVSHNNGRVLGTEFRNARQLKLSRR